MVTTARIEYDNGISADMIMPNRKMVEFVIINWESVKTKSMFISPEIIISLEALDDGQKEWLINTNTKNCGLDKNSIEQLKEYFKEDWTTLLVSFIPKDGVIVKGSVSEIAAKLGIQI